MTREEQKKLRELNRALPQIIKSEIKKYKLKKKDYMVWFQKNDLFFSLLIDVRERDGHCYCSSIEQIKPMWIDDLLWDILGMPENKNEPVSLRAIGAFTVYGSEIYSTEEELVSWEPNELEKYVVQYLEHFYQNIQLCEIEKFYECMHVSPYHQELRKGLSLIHNGEYQKAIDYLETCDEGSLCNRGIWSNTAMIKYSKRKIKGLGKFRLFKQ